MLVSVIIPTYNYAHHILTAINSLYNQTYPVEKIEIIVVDDGSKDDTKKILADLIGSGKIQYYYQDNSGKSSATSLGIRKATGEIIFNLDADDYYLPDKIKQSVSLYLQYPEVVHVASAARIHRESLTDEREVLEKRITDKPLNGWALLEHFYSNNYIYGGGSTFSARASVLKTLEISESVDMYIDEFLLLATLPYGYSYIFSEPLSVWRIHGNNFSMARDEIFQEIKYNRLLKSSAAILSSLSQIRGYNPKICKLYSLVHLNRQIYFKEVLGKKTLVDILKLLYFIFHNRISFKVLSNYKIYNRLIPQFAIWILKGRMV